MSRYGRCAACSGKVLERMGRHDRPVPPRSGFLRLHVTGFRSICTASRGASLEEIGNLTWIPFLALGVSSLIAGAVSDGLVRRGWPIGRARKTIMAAAAFLTPVSMLALIRAEFSLGGCSTGYTHVRSRLLDDKLHDSHWRLVSGSQCCDSSRFDRNGWRNRRGASESRRCSCRSGVLLRACLPGLRRTLSGWFGDYSSCCASGREVGMADTLDACRLIYL